MNKYEDKAEILNDIEHLKRRIEEAEAIVKANESPFSHLSYIKSDITNILRKLSSIRKER